MHLAPEPDEPLRPLGRSRLRPQGIDGAALEGAVRGRRQDDLYADLVRNVVPEHEVREQGEVAGAHRQGVVPLCFARDVDGASEAARVVDRVVVGQGLLGGGGMHELHVVGLDEVLHQELPVRGHLPEVDGGEMVEAGKVEPVEPAFERRREVFEGRRGAVGVDEDPVVPRRRPHRRQPMLRAVEARRRRARIPAAEVGGEPEASVEAVGPRVVGAADGAAHVAGGVDELEVAVAADVVERPDPSPAVAHQEQGLAGHADRHRVTGPGQLVRKAGEDPRAGKEPFVLEREERLARIGGGGQSAGHRPRGVERGQRLGADDRLE